MYHGNVKLDPWSASSLLQKSVRRGEPELAKLAARAYYGWRGSAIWRRLLGIALEDIGIADIGLVSDVVWLSTDKGLRTVLGGDVVPLADICVRMANAPKDRSADYIFCGATKLRVALEERVKFAELSFSEKARIASDNMQPVVRRSVAALSACADNFSGKLWLSAEAVRNLAAEFSRVPDAVLSIATTLTEKNSHAFGLMLLLLWSQCDFTGGARGQLQCPVPLTEEIDGIPLYTFDKHTAVGKRAISQLVRQDKELRRILDQYVPRDRWADATLMAAFYADAVPVALKLQWFGSELHENLGFVADMESVGCSQDAAPRVLMCVKESLHELNALRREALAAP